MANLPFKELSSSLHQAIGNLPIIGPVMEPYSKWLKQRGYRASTVDLHFSSLRQLVRWLQRKRYRRLKELDAAIAAAYTKSLAVAVPPPVAATDAIIPGFDDGKDAWISIILERTDEQEHCLKVHVSGRIDTYNSSYFYAAAEKLVSSGFVYIVFCCANLDYVSSSGIGAFTRIHPVRLPVGGTSSKGG